MNDPPTERVTICSGRGSTERDRDIPKEGSEMLGWSLTFFVLAIVAAICGFTGIAGAAAGIAKILFFVFLLLLIVSALSRSMRGGTP